MTRFRFASLVFVASLALAGCDKKQVVNVIGPSPTPPTTSPPAGASITRVSLSSPDIETTLSTCFVSFTFDATVDGTGSFDSNVTWAATGPDTKVFNYLGRQSKIDIKTNGTYTVTATSVQDPSKSKTVTIRVFGNCGGTNPPGPGPGPGPAPTPDRVSLSFVPHGDTKPVGTKQELTATCKKNDVVVACLPKWTSSVTDVVRIIGPDVNQKVTIEYVSPHTAVVTATWEGVSDSASFRGTESGPGPGPTPPPAPQCRNGKDDDGDGKIDHPAARIRTTMTREIPLRHRHLRPRSRSTSSRRPSPAPSAAKPTSEWWSTVLRTSGSPGRSRTRASSRRRRSTRALSS
jgi:hypothetical protein